MVVLEDDIGWDMVLLLEVGPSLGIGRVNLFEVVSEAEDTGVGERVGVMGGAVASDRSWAAEDLELVFLCPMHRSSQGHVKIPEENQPTTRSSFHLYVPHLRPCCAGGSRSQLSNTALFSS